MSFLVFSIAFLTIAYITISLVMRPKLPVVPFSAHCMSVDICTICKGFSILIIMLAHAGNRFGIRYLTPLGSWGVGIFLYLSGYGLTVSYSKNGLSNYWKKRLATAYLPYLFAEIFAYLFQPGSSYADLDLLQIVLDLTLLKPLHPYGWYMQCLFVYYIAFYTASYMFPNRQSLRIFLLFIVSVSLFVFCRSIFKQQFFSFILGSVLACYFPQLQKYLDKFSVGCSCFFLGAIALLLRQISWIRDSHWIVYNAVFALQVFFLSIGTICIVHWVSSRSLAWALRPLSYTGLISFELCLYHGFVYHWFDKSSVSYTGIVVFFLASFVLSACAHCIRKRISLLMHTIVKQNKS